MNRTHRQEVVSTLLPLVLLVLLVQAVAPVMSVLRAAPSGAALAGETLGGGMICRVADGTAGDPAPHQAAGHEACPMCSQRIDIALPAPHPPELPAPAAAAAEPRLHPAYRLAQPRAPPADPLQPRAPPTVS